MAGYGLSRALQGAVQGMDATEARRDRASDREYTGLQRERETTQFDQSQQDREFALGRRDIETERGDKEYQRLEGNRMRKIAVNDAVKAWQMKGDLTGLNTIANEYTPEGVDMKITKNKDGTYTMATTGGGKTESEVVDENKLGSYAMMLNDDDFVATMQGQSDKEGERAHDIAKIDRKGSWDAKVKGIGASGTGSAGSKEQRMLVSQGNSTLNTQYGGTLDGMNWFPSAENKDEGLVAKAILSGKIYSGMNDSNAAALQAVNEAKGVAAAADRQVADEIKAGKLNEDKTDQRRSELIRQFGNEAAAQYGVTVEDQQAGQGDEGPALGREDTGAQTDADTGKKPTKKAAGVSWEKYLESAKKRAPAGMSDAEIEKKARDVYDSKTKKSAPKLAPKKKTTPIEDYVSGKDQSVKPVDSPTLGERNAGKKPTGKNSSGSVVTAKQALGPRAKDEKASSNKPGKGESVKLDRTSERNPRKAFDADARAYKNGFRRNPKATAKKVLDKYTPKLVDKLTKKQQMKAAELILNAKTILGKD